jgi:hypothetical protein
MNKSAEASWQPNTAHLNGSEIAAFASTFPFALNRMSRLTIGGSITEDKRIYSLGFCGILAA